MDLYADITANEATSTQRVLLMIDGGISAKVIGYNVFGNTLLQLVDRLYYAMENRNRSCMI